MNINKLALGAEELENYKRKMLTPKFENRKESR